MRKLALLLLVTALWAVSDSQAEAQVAYVTYYQPVTYYRPAPACCTPAPAVVAAPVVPVYQPVARVRTRYRPFLGGTVTRVRYGYAPAYYAPAPMAPAPMAPAPVVYAY